MSDQYLKSLTLSTDQLSVNTGYEAWADMSVAAASFCYDDPAVGYSNILVGVLIRAVYCCLRRALLGMMPTV